MDPLVQLQVKVDAMPQCQAPHTLDVGHERPLAHIGYQVPEAAVVEKSRSRQLTDLVEAVDVQAPDSVYHAVAVFEHEERVLHVEEDDVSLCVEVDLVPLVQLQIVRVVL